jgi:DNA-directed RNA polymerase specialized sigma24 family protein
VTDGVRQGAPLGASPPTAIDPAELEVFYRLFFLPLVRRAVRRHGMSFEDAGDVVQDAFVLAVGKLNPERNPKAWLYSVVDHLAVNARRKTLRRARLVERWQPREDQLRRSGSVPDE